MSVPRMQRVVEVIRSSGRCKEVAAVLVPRRFALSLVDELYPKEDICDAGAEAGDEELVRRYLKRESERKRYFRLVLGGGYVGSFMGTPMIVARDVVLCALSDDEVSDLAGSVGFDASEVLERRVGYGHDRS